MAGSAESAAAIQAVHDHVTYDASMDPLRRGIAARRLQQQTRDEEEAAEERMRQRSAPRQASRVVRPGE